MSAVCVFFVPAQRHNFCYSSFTPGWRRKAIGSDNPVISERVPELSPWAALPCSVILQGQCSATQRPDEYTPLKNTFTKAFASAFRAFLPGCPCSSLKANNSPVNSAHLNRLFSPRSLIRGKIISRIFYDCVCRWHCTPPVVPVSGHAGLSSHSVSG